jgi:hypothetical protein
MRRLQQIPGVGPLITHALVMAVGDARRFDTARDCAAWIGLTPPTNNSAEETRIGHISRQGDHSLRRLLGLGAINLMRRARVKPDQASAWAQGIMARRPFKVATVAQAARIAASPGRCCDRATTIRPWRRIPDARAAEIALSGPDCACAVACGVKLEPPLAVAARGLTPHATAKPRSGSDLARATISVAATLRPHRKTPIAQEANCTDGKLVRTRTRTLRSVIVRSARRDAGNLVRVTHRGQRSFQTAPAGRDAPDRSAVTAFASCLTGGRSYMAVSV